MSDLLLLVTMFVVCGGVGLPVARLLPERFAWRVLVAPTLGYGVLAVAVPVVYKAGLSLRAFLYGSIAIALAMFVLYGKRLVREAALVERRTLIAIALAYVGALVIMLAPRWYGGDRFSVFQGNLWDTYAYLESGVVYARESYAFVAGADEAILRANPLISQAQTSLSNRPSVHQLYGVFSNVRPSQSYRLYYPFLVFSYSQFVLVALFVLRTILPAKALHWSVAIACVVPLGFWGQYVFDINAWSQIASMPGLFLMFGLAVDIAARAETDLRAAGRLAGVLAITVAGAFYLYPEGLVIYAAATGPIATAPVIYRMIRARRFSLAAAVPLLGFLGIATMVLYAPMFEFMTGQVTRSAAGHWAWWQYFQIFFLGRDAQPGQVTDYAASFFGLYFATPTGGGALALVQRFVIVIAIASVLAGTIALVARKDDARKRIIAWTICAILLLAPAVGLFLDKNYWPAGKIVSYAAPVYMMLACLPAAFAFTRRPLRIARGIVVVFIVFQLACGLARITVARRAVHYARPYPAAQFLDLKNQFAWSLRKLERRLTPKTHVLVRTTDLWFTEHLAVFLYTRGIPFARASASNTYFDSGKDLGVWQPPWQPDVEIVQEGDVVVARFRDGRPSVRIVAKR